MCRSPPNSSATTAATHYTSCAGATRVLSAVIIRANAHAISAGSRRFCVIVSNLCKSLRAGSTLSPLTSMVTYGHGGITAPADSATAQWAATKMSPHNTRAAAIRVPPVQHLPHHATVTAYTPQSLRATLTPSPLTRTVTCGHGGITSGTNLATAQRAATKMSPRNTRAAAIRESPALHFPHHVIVTAYTPQSLRATLTPSPLTSRVIFGYGGGTPMDNSATAHMAGQITKVSPRNIRVVAIRE